jgi:two-component system nitrate/nitrite response regulator NarL
MTTSDAGGLQLKSGAAGVDIPASCDAAVSSRTHSGKVAVRLLIVDDNAYFLAAARRLLEREGMTVLGVASTGAEAFRLARELRPDVTLLDVDLGEESGFDVARRLAAAGDGESTPVILISAYPKEDLGDQVDASPALGFVPKSSLSAKAITDVLRGTDSGGP